MMVDRPLVLENSGGILHLILNSPPRNEMNRAFFEEFDRILTRRVRPHSWRGLIIRGRGRHFSSGADVAELKGIITAATADEAKDILGRTTGLFGALEDLPFPVVAAINGCCFGSALELALACRWRISAANALFALPESGYGLMPGLGGTVRLPALVGVGRAVELVISGRIFPAEEALAMGLVHQLAAADEVGHAAVNCVKRLNPDEGDAGHADTAN